MDTQQPSGPRGRFWLPALLFLAFILLNIGGFWYYRRAEERQVSAVGQRLLRSTEQVARRLDLYMLEVWRDPFLPDSATRQLVTRMVEQLQTSPELESFRIYTPQGADWVTALDDSTATVEPAPLAAGKAFDSATVGVAFVSDLYRSRDEYFLAACVPVYDFDSTVGAVALAEAGNEYFGSLRELRSGLLVLDAFAGLLLLTIGLIWMGVQSRLVRAEAAALRSAQLAAMGQMVATVAHELKNPLGIIKNTAERLKKKYGAEGEPLFDFIPQEVDRLHILLKRYLQFARMEIAHSEPVPLLPLAEKLENQLTLQEYSQTRFMVRIPEDLAVSADPDALRQILLNLLLNALEACRRNDGGEVQVIAMPHGGAVELVVADTGVGMDAETLRRAAEPFFTTRPDGSGLGIYLAQTLTEKMGGRMTIRSRAGEGTSVSVILPCGRHAGEGEPMKARVLIVDDEVKMGVLLAGTLEDEGYDVMRTERGDQAISLMKKHHFDVVITDLRMSPVDGLAVLQEARKAHPECVVILMTAHASVETAVSAMKAGAADYIAKPFSLDELVMLVKHHLHSRRLADQVQVLKSDLARYVEHDFVGHSQNLKDVLEMVRRVAPTDASVLITGESGTGKELVARAIHATSPRGEGPFVAINCAALPESLLESELFGHEKGSFTGAIARKRGRFELAHGGTIFLDEVGEIAPGIQAKLLRALEEHAFTRVGGVTVQTVDVRMVAATNRDLVARMQEGTFREDLFFRLNVFPIHIPPLRERGDDVIELAEHYLRAQGSSAALAPDARQALLEYDWPGNVRELRNVLERAVILSGSDTIRAADLHLLSRPKSDKSAVQASGGMVEVEKQMILGALERTGGNKAEAARLLKITRRMLYSRMKKHGLPV